MTPEAFRDYLLPILALAIAIASAAFAARSNAVTHASHLAELRREWDSLQRAWAITVLFATSSMSYYVDASEGQRHLVADLERRSKKDSRAFLDRARVAQMGQYVADAKLDDDVRAFRPSIQMVRRFLVNTAHLVLAGRISITDAYFVFGTEVPGHGSVLRWVAAVDPPAPGWDFTPSDPRFYETPSQEGAYIESQWSSRKSLLRASDTLGQRDLILCLLDLLWAERCRWQDAEPHRILSVAAHKVRTRSGHLCRQRVRRLGRAQGNAIRAWRLGEHLRRAEVVHWPEDCMYLSRGDVEVIHFLRGSMPYWGDLRGYLAKRRWLRDNAVAKA